MGGFVLYDENNPQSVILPNQLSLFRDRYELEITSQEIWDRSKGDLLSKGLVLLQVAWFVIQCIARAYQNLVITQLEVMTLAFAALNFVMYALWWNKPLGVECSVHVRRNRGQKDSNSVVPKDVFHVSDLLTVVVRSLRDFLSVPLRKHSESMPSIGHDINHSLGLGLIGQLVMGLDDNIPINPPSSKIPDPITDYTNGDLDSSFCSPSNVEDTTVRNSTNNVDLTSQRLPTFYSGWQGYYAPDLDDNHKELAIFQRITRSPALLAVPVAAVFGAIHCTTWSSIFPTHAEQRLCCS
ncbi:hypothetical protein VKT23_016935 [Stygiomarasmius scandens]|uniref:Uncharacterized protein n=1 Tax=Marasmiellus scandens TaxID=2682957 RepID=A0ABR1IWD4_9AGAR